MTIFIATGGPPDPGQSMAAIHGLSGPSVVPYRWSPCHKWSPLNYPYRNDVCKGTMGRATNNHYYSFMIASCTSAHPVEIAWCCGLRCIFESYVAIILRYLKQKF